MNKNNGIFLKIFSIISMAFTTLLMTNIGSTKLRIISVFLSILITSVLVFKYDILSFVNKKKYNTISIINAFASAFYFCTEFYWFNAVRTGRVHDFLDNPPIIPKELLYYCLIGLSIYSLYVTFNLFYNYIFEKLVKIFKSFDKLEKRYFYTASILLIILIVVSYSITNIFYKATINGELQAFDVIYSSDTGAHAVLNSYISVNSVENDIRQPLFAMFSLPFALIPYMIGLLFPVFDNGYLFLIAIVQALLLVFITVLLTRMIKVKKNRRVYFMILYSISYPFILFSLNLEQYVFALFWLVLFIYDRLKHTKSNKILFAGAAGSLLTSGVLFPLLANGKKWKKWINDFVIAGLVILTILTLFGQLPIILDLSKDVDHVSNYVTKGISFTKLCMYTKFVFNCFYAPITYIVLEILGTKSFQLPIPTSINIIGCVIILTSIYGFIKSKNNKVSQISLFWIVYSFIVLVILGYGTNENGLILYSLYFGWAYIILVFKAIETLFKKNDLLFNVFMITMFVSMLIMNSYGYYKLIQHGIVYFDWIV